MSFYLFELLVMNISNRLFLTAFSHRSVNLLAILLTLTILTTLASLPKKAPISFGIHYTLLDIVSNLQ